MVKLFLYFLFALKKRSLIQLQFVILAYRARRVWFRSDIDGLFSVCAEGGDSATLAIGLGGAA